MQNSHTFHIPVLGIGFSLDAPAKVAKYGISSVMSIVDDQIAEQVRGYYCRQRNEEYIPITDEDPDPRANRITAYLNLIGTIVRERSAALQSAAFEPGSEITTYFELLPEQSELHTRYNTMLACTDPTRRAQLQQELRAAIEPGDIDVNIMVKVDKDNYRNGEKLPAEYADAMAALRGYARSELDSSVVLSAGFNRRLARYMESFAAFQPDASGYLRKKIVLKVSDFRSALTQARMFARSGLWISEFRIESGLNCGGHTFATDGYLLGPVLEEFKTRREELLDTLFAIYTDALVKRGSAVPPRPAFRITAQGGVGTPSEHDFLLQHYAVDSVGWGSPFLLVPECINVDPDTLGRLAAAGGEQIVSSGASPLGVPFSNLTNSASEIHKHELARRGKPGSPCPKGLLKFNTEFTELPICTASRTYQRKKIAELNARNLPADQYQQRHFEIIERVCLCRDLSGSVAINYKTDAHAEKPTPAVCPGPNLAFFTKVASLREMVDHIYGRINLINGARRPHMFVNELKLYVSDLARQLLKTMRDTGARSAQEFRSYRDNLLQGIEYYRSLINSLDRDYAHWKTALMAEIATAKHRLDELSAAYPDLDTPADA